MIVFTQKELEAYSARDIILEQMTQTATDLDSEFTSHRWLKNSLPKRMIFDAIYGDLLAEKSKLSILDIGGGVTSLSRLLIQNQQYTLLDIMAHDSQDNLHKLSAELEREFWLAEDWYSYEPDQDYDMIIANDLFPNVDQRLGMFIDKYLPICRELRLSLTYYNSPRWYQVKRVDGDEIFHMMAWDGVQLQRVLQPYHECIAQVQLEKLTDNPPSLFANGRQVCMVVIQGERSA